MVSFRLARAMGLLHLSSIERVSSLAPIASKHLRNLIITPPMTTTSAFIPWANKDDRKRSLLMTVSFQEEGADADFFEEAVVAVSSEGEAVLKQSSNALDSTNDGSTNYSVIWQRLVRRLNTHEDMFGVHKLSSLVWLVTSAGMLGTGILNGFSDIPDSLQIPTWLLLGSSVIQSITGIRMALKYREKDPVVQKGFINMSMALVNLAYTCVYLSPFATEESNEFWVGNGLLILTMLPLVVMGSDEFFNLTTKMQHRRIRNKEPSLVDFGVVGDLFSYGLAVVTGFVGAMQGLWFAADPSHDRTWLLHAASDMFGSPHYLAESYYSLILYNLGVGFGALAITLRDKKLIGKNIEQTMVAMCVIPGAYLNIHALVSF